MPFADHGLRALSLIVTLMLLAGCETSSHQPPSPVVSDVGTTGGMLELESGAAVTIPAGALDSTVTIQVIERVPDELPDAPDGLKIITYPVAFLPHGTFFNDAATLNIPINGVLAENIPINGDSPFQVQVLRLSDETQSTWELYRVVDALAGEASFSVVTFSVYALAAIVVDDDGGTTFDASAFSFDADIDSGPCEFGSSSCNEIACGTCAGLLDVISCELAACAVNCVNGGGVVDTCVYTPEPTTMASTCTNLGDENIPTLPYGTFECQTDPNVPCPGTLTVTGCGSVDCSDSCEAILIHDACARELVCDCAADFHCELTGWSSVMPCGGGYLKRAEWDCIAD